MLGLQDERLESVVKEHWAGWVAVEPRLGVVDEPARLDAWRRAAEPAVANGVLLGLAQLSSVRWRRRPGCRSCWRRLCQRALRMRAGWVWPTMKSTRYSPPSCGSRSAACHGGVRRWGGREGRRCAA